VLPSPFVTVLPAEGVVREGQSDEILAFGGTPEERASLLSLRGTQVTLLGPAPAGAEYLPYSNRGNPISAPANLHGSGCVRLNPDERAGVVRVAVHDDEARFRARYTDARNEKRCNEA